MNQEAAKAVTKARTQMIYHQRFYSCLALNLEPKESPAAASTAFEGRTYFYNPDYILSLTEAQRMGSWAQAVTGCVYKHPMRRQWRDQRRWSLACAYVINLDVLAAGFELPPGAVVEPKFLGMSAEEVYEQLNQKDESQQQQQPQAGEGEGEGSGSQKPDDSSDNKDQDDGEGDGGGGQDDDHQQPGGGQGDQTDGEGDQEGQGGAGGGGGGQDRTPQQEYDPGGAGEVLDACDAHDANSNKDESDRWDQHARAAMAIAKAANAGDIPGELARIYNTLNEPRIDWRDVTRLWAQNSVRKDESWARPNKRFLPRRIYLPGTISDRPNKLVLIGDTSGSMTPRLWNEISTEVQAMLDEGVADEIIVVYTDTKFQGADFFEAFDELKLNPKGGGGTHFKEVWKWIAENIDDPAGVIFFTDLLTSDHGEGADCPVLWAVHGSKQAYPALASKVPFGETVFIDYH